MSNVNINTQTSDQQESMLTNNHLREVKSLYEHYGAKLYGLLLKKSGDEKLAEEILTKTFEKAYTVLTNSANHPISFSWFLHTAKNLCSPDANRISTNAVTMEEQILEMIICSGASLSHVAETLKKTESEIKQILKSTLKTYRQ